MSKNNRFNKSAAQQLRERVRQQAEQTGGPNLHPANPAADDHRSWELNSCWRTLRDAMEGEGSMGKVHKANLDDRAEEAIQYSGERKKTTNYLTDKTGEVLRDAVTRLAKKQMGSGEAYSVEEALNQVHVMMKLINKLIAELPDECPDSKSRSEMESLYRQVFSTYLHRAMKQFYDMDYDPNRILSQGG